MRVLLVTNDFPPTVGGIQSYLRDFIDTLPPKDVVVFASTQNAHDACEWDSRARYKVYRWPCRIMLPSIAVRRRMQEIIHTEGIDVVWFGAAAPLALMARAARVAGARRVVASTHGHEVGWSMIPGARCALRKIGRDCDMVTYISKYTLDRFRSVLGEVPVAWLPSGVSIERFRVATPRQRSDARSRLGWDSAKKYVLCISRLVPRKGQDLLLQAWPQILERHSDAVVVLVGEGKYHRRLERLAGSYAGQSVLFAGRVPDSVAVDMLTAADIFAMPCRTRGGGLDVEGLGIVYLEAQASGIPVIAGNSGGAPETVTPESGIVVSGRDVGQLVSAVDTLLSDAQRRVLMGQSGRAHVEQHWTWDLMGRRLRSVLQGDG